MGKEVKVYAGQNSLENYLRSLGNGSAQNHDALARLHCTYFSSLGVNVYSLSRDLVQLLCAQLMVGQSHLRLRLLPAQGTPQSFTLSARKVPPPFCEREKRRKTYLEHCSFYCLTAVGE